jgi:hypothetical protein
VPLSPNSADSDVSRKLRAFSATGTRCDNAGMSENQPPASNFSRCWLSCHHQETSKSRLVMEDSRGDEFAKASLDMDVNANVKNAKVSIVSSEYETGDLRRSRHVFTIDHLLSSSHAVTKK